MVTEWLQVPRTGAGKILACRARQNSPSVIFFDEIDGLASKRVDGDEANGMRNRVLATLLMEMDTLHVNPFPFHPAAA